MKQDGKNAGRNQRVICRIQLFLWVCLVLSGSLQAKLTFQNSLVEVYAAADAEQVSGDYVFTVTGDQPVEIVKVDAYCSCLKAQINQNGKLRWEPGESGVIRGIFSKLGMFKGTVDKSIRIYLKGDPPTKPSVHLTFRVHVPILLDISQKTSRWTTGGEATEQIIHLTVKSVDPMQILSVEGTNDLFLVELVVLEQGRSYQLKVRPKHLENPAYGIIKVHTDSSIPRHAKHQLFCVVSAPKK